MAKATFFIDINIVFLKDHTANMAHTEYGTTWWGQQWLQALSGIDYANRIARGKTYANTGKVYNFTIDEAKNLIKARVEGNYDPFYTVKIILPKIDDKKKKAFIDELAASPLVIAKLSSRELDPSVLEIAKKVGIDVFPTKWSDFKMHCSCPDSAVPCKHLAAVIYKISEEIDANPFILFTLRNIDIIEELKNRKVNIEQASLKEMISYQEILLEDVHSPIYEETQTFDPNSYDEETASYKQINKGSILNSKLPFYGSNNKGISFGKPKDNQNALKTLSQLSFTTIEPCKDGIINLFSETPAGYIYGSLRDVMSQVLDKASKIADKQLKDKTDRDLPFFDEEEPLITIDNFGCVKFAKDLSWKVYPTTAGTDGLVFTMPDPKDKEFTPKNLAYALFSGFITEKSFEDKSEALEALYHTWVIATKLVISGAIIPQIYAPIEDLFAVRWIPAIIKEDIASLVNDLGLRLKGLVEHYVKIERAPVNISPKALANFYLSIFINSYVEQGYFAYLKDRQEPSVECKALFRQQVIDIDDYNTGEAIAMRLDAWIAPLYMDSNCEANPVLWLYDLLDDKDTVINEQVLKEKIQAQFEEAVDVYQEDTDSAKETTTKEDFDIGSEVLTPSIDLNFGFNHLVDDDPNQFVSIAKIVNDDEYKNARFECLRMISRLASFCPTLYKLLKKTNSDDLHTKLDMIELAKVMQESIPSLELLGVQVIIPKSLRTIFRPQSQLSVGLKRSSDSATTKFTSLRELLDFNWKLAIGNKNLSESDFEYLCQKAGQLVRFNDQFIYVDPKEISKIQKQLEKQKKLDSGAVLRSVLTGSFGDDEVDVSGELKLELDNLFKLKEVELPKDLNATLRPYQVRGYSWMYKNLKASIGAILADDMGLGKTLQTITLLEKLREEGAFKEKQALIVVPTTLMSNWAHELNKFAPKLKYSFLYGSNAQINPKADLIITTYGNLRTKLKDLKQKEFALMIIDEAQAIKNRKTSTFSSVRAIKADGKIALSGTPVENRLSEYWSIMDYTNPGLLGSADLFNREYAKPIECQRDAKVLEKFKKLTSPFIMRRLKTDKSIISDLPDKVISDQFIPLTKEQTALYQKIVDKYLKMLDDPDFKGLERASLILNLMLKLKQICNSPYQYLKTDTSLSSYEFSGKGQHLMELLDEFSESNKKALIFTQFKEMGTILQQWIKDTKGIEVPFLHGGLSVDERARMVDKFQNQRSDKFMILSLKAAGTGLNLTAASAVVHYDLWWNPAVEAQATDRAYRIGQKQNVQVYRFISENTFEEKINAIIESKKELAELTVNAGENWIGDLSTRQLKDIFTLK